MVHICPFETIRKDASSIGQGYYDIVLLGQDPQDSVTGQMHPPLTG